MSVALANRIVEDHNVSNYSTVCSVLSKEFKNIGKGAFGTTFEVTKSKVFKVYKKHDVAYKTFHYIASRVNSVHYPEFYSDSSHNKFNTVCMERLKPYNLTTNYGMSTEDVIDILGKSLRNPDWQSKVVEAFPESLRQAAAAIHPFSEYFVVDVTRKNLARRGNTVVILDPLANMYENAPN
jgi:hypothetical protein